MCQKKNKALVLGLLVSGSVFLAGPSFAKGSGSFSDEGVLVSPSKAETFGQVERQEINSHPLILADNDHRDRRKDAIKEFRDKKREAREEYRDDMKSIREERRLKRNERRESRRKDMMEKRKQLRERRKGSGEVGPVETGGTEETPPSPHVSGAQVSPGSGHISGSSGGSTTGHISGQ